MKIKKLEWYDWLVVAMFILFIFMLAWKILGDSPTEFQMFSTLAGLIGTLAIRNTSAISKLNREIGEMKTDFNHRLTSLEKGQEEIKELLKKSF